MAGPGALYYRHQMDASLGENPFTVTTWKSWKKMLLEDILNHIDCQPWAEKK